MGMRRLPLAMTLVTLVLVISLSPAVLADELTEKSNAFMEKFIEAMNTGNYSLIEPYLSERLKSELGEREFAQLRDFTIENYGRLLSFKFVNETRDGNLVKLEYEVKAEKGTFPVALTYKNGELVGIGLGIKAKPNPSGMAAMILGALLALGLFYLLKKPSVPDLVFGSGVALGLSVIIPFYGLVSLVMFYSTLSRALFTAVLTALTVEGVKFYFSRDKDGLSLGLGLGIGQYVLLSIGTFVATNFIMQLPVSFTGPTYWAFLFALAFTVFHAVSAGTYSLRKKPADTVLFAVLEAFALFFEGNNPSISLLFAILGIAVGLKLGGVFSGISGRKAH
ncbi:DUF3887 domain-containing protein [Thermococcus sp.]|uniref:DUF3887 domain-containing protein n=1 Tax=Thermococcus sp. TaxID=35749 RepID=UPI00261D0DFD|nr:DUF3887 domain-containing protein [Thermococcus sp.]